MKTAYYLTFCIWFLHIQSSICQEVNWVSFDALPNLINEESKPIMIFIHTDWCKVCATQEETTFRNQEVVQYLNDNYYALKLDAESSNDITFLNRSYHYRSTGVETGIHELAEILAKRMGMVSYPTTIILTKERELSERLVGLQSAGELLTMLSKK